MSRDRAEVTCEFNHPANFAAVFKNRGCEVNVVFSYFAALYNTNRLLLIRNLATITILNAASDPT